VTNNICELMAIRVALGQILSQAGSNPYILYTDSAYAINCVTTWYRGFVARGWRTSTGSAVKNRDLISDIRSQLDTLGATVTLQHIRGHAGHAGNEAADALAVAACGVRASSPP
jgi:ribonuclease HI